jgi:hypothetical protein
VLSNDLSPPYQCMILFCAIEQDHPKSYSCTSCICLSLSHDRLVEVAVSDLFGLCHRRWTTTPPLLIFKCKCEDTPSLRSVMVIRPRVNIPHIPWESHPGGMNWIAPLSMLSKIAYAEISNPSYRWMKRTKYGFICDLLHLREFRSSYYIA